MVEKIPSEIWESNHSIGVESFLGDSRLLLRHFMASESLSGLLEKDIEGRFLDSYDPTEISKLLISIATFYRVKYDDGGWIHAPEFHHKEYDGVGVLTKDIESPDHLASLEFKEACNKIIHTQKIHFDVSEHRNTKVEFVNPTVYLYGKKYKTEWKAELDIIKFCMACENVVF